MNGELRGVRGTNLKEDFPYGRVGDFDVREVEWEGNGTVVVAFAVFKFFKFRFTIRTERGRVDECLCVRLVAREMGFVSELVVRMIRFAGGVNLTRLRTKRAHIVIRLRLLRLCCISATRLSRKRCLPVIGRANAGVHGAKTESFERPLRDGSHHLRVLASRSATLRPRCIRRSFKSLFKRRLIP